MLRGVAIRVRRKVEPMPPPEVEVRYKNHLSTDPNPIVHAQKALESAQDSIEAVVYKIEPPGIFTAIEQAIAQRGVDVKILVNSGLPKRLMARAYKTVSRGSSKPPDPEVLGKVRRKLKKWPQKRLFDLATRHPKGLEVREWTPAKLHVKFLIIDDKRVLTGSYNLTDSAGRDNAELLLDFTGPAEVSQFKDAFEALWQADGALPFIRERPRR